MGDGSSSNFLFSPKYPHHAVTEDGRVYSFLTRRFLRGMPCGKYRAVNIHIEGGGKAKVYIHRLVAEIAYGGIPAGLEVCHNDGNRMNNAVWNLRWDTPAGNQADRAIHGTKLEGADNPMAKLSWDQVRAIRAEVASGVTQRTMCKRFGVSPMTVSRIIRNETWRVE